MRSTPEQFARKIALANLAGPKAILASLVQEAEIILTASKRDYVPVDTGALRASGFTEPPVQTATGGSVTFGFGGAAAPYAVLVHEDLTVRHRVGQAKYLEIPTRARIQGMQAVLRMRVRNAMQQSFQRLGKVEANVRAGREVNAGMPLFAGE